MSIGDISDKIDRFNRAARQEKLHSPQIIQATKTVRFPEDVSLRRAITTQDATAQTYITVNLYDKDGLEITEGEGSGIDVYCTIAGGGNLDKAMPKLTNGTNIWVSKYKEGDEDKWGCISTIFQKLNIDQLKVDATNGLQTTISPCT
jgi:hypothetical protein